MTQEEIGRDLYARKRPLSSCNGSEERRGWILAQHEATEARRCRDRARITGAEGGKASRGKPRKQYDRAPDWWLDEMKDALDEDAA